MAADQVDAIEMAAFEQQIAQGLLEARLKPYEEGKAQGWVESILEYGDKNEDEDIINNINERFNGWFDRFSGELLMPDSISNTIRMLNEKYPGHDFDFSKQQHRFNLATGLIELQYSAEKSAEESGKGQ